MQSQGLPQAAPLVDHGKMFRQCRLGFALSMYNLGPRSQADQRSSMILALLLCQLYVCTCMYIISCVVAWEKVIGANKNGLTCFGRFCSIRIPHHRQSRDGSVPKNPLANREAELEHFRKLFEFIEAVCSEGPLPFDSMPHLIFAFSDIQSPHVPVQNIANMQTFLLCETVLTFVSILHCFIVFYYVLFVLDVLVVALIALTPAMPAGHRVTVHFLRPMVTISI